MKQQGLVRNAERALQYQNLIEKHWNTKNEASSNIICIFSTTAGTFIDL